MKCGPVGEWGNDHTVVSRNFPCPLPGVLALKKMPIPGTFVKLFEVVGCALLSR